jgi:hypothetical protein
MFSEASGTGVLSLVLASQPTSFVTIVLTSSDTTEGQLVNVSAITFTSSTWSMVRTVTVTGVDDDVVDGDAVLFLVVTATSDDTIYSSLDATNVSFTSLDGKLLCFVVVCNS